MPSSLRDVLEKGPRAAQPSQTGAIAHGTWTPVEHALLRDLHLLTDKPVMYVANVDENVSRTIRV